MSLLRKEKTFSDEQIIWFFENKAKLKYIGEGMFGEVRRYENYAIKFFRQKQNTDGNILEILNGEFGFPKIYFNSPEMMITEFIEGPMLEEYVDLWDCYCEDLYDYLNEFKIPNDFEEQLWKIFRFCLSRNILPFDCTPVNIINSPSGLRIVDVGAFKISKSEKDIEFSIHALKRGINYIKEIKEGC